MARIFRTGKQKVPLYQTLLIQTKGDNSIPIINFKEGLEEKIKAKPRMCYLHRLRVVIGKKKKKTIIGCNTHWSVFHSPTLVLGRLIALILLINSPLFAIYHLRMLIHANLSGKTSCSIPLSTWKNIAYSSNFISPLSS